MAARGAWPVLVALALALTVSRPRRGRGAAAPWLALVLACAVLVGLVVGDGRLAALDGRALQAQPGVRLELRGPVVTPPRIDSRGIRFVIDSPAGRIAIRSPDGSSPPDLGQELVVVGRVTEPAPWERPALRRAGAEWVLTARQLDPTGARRGGLHGAFDAVRRRAQRALASGTDPVAAALLRGFVLGEDDRIPDDVRDEFRRSSLAHVLAVSGQNVMLLILLATPLLALLGVPLGARRLLLIALVAIYVPVAGADPSIQRAGVMGIAGLVAALSSRPRARWYALFLAAVVTLALDPRASAHVGWQLSFAAVIGLFLLTEPLLRAMGIAERSGAGGDATPFATGSASRPIRRALAEGAAMTIAATVATLPLIAHHFGVVSLTAVPANLLALPAVAPAMWLGMLSAALGQIPAAPVEAVTMLGGLCAAYVGWVARTLGPAAAQLEIDEPAPFISIMLTAVLLAGAWAASAVVERRRALRPALSRSGVQPRGAARCLRPLTIAACAFGMAGAGALLAPDPPPRPDPDFEIRALDVGQGDAILLVPRASAPVLVDTGPPGGGAAERLVELGVERLAAVLVTHDDLDHSGGLGEVLGRIEVDQLVGGPGRAPRACRRGLACPALTRLAAGDSLRAPGLRLDVLWPTADAPPGAERNATSLVVVARHGSFDALLTGDAEAEVAPVAPGDVELLKVAHHGSADPGLAGLLARASPELAVISVGADNGYGHPTPQTLTELSAHEVEIMRTDQDGEVTVAVAGDAWTVE